MPNFTLDELKRWLKENPELKVDKSDLASLTDKGWTVVVSSREIFEQLFLMAWNNRYPDVEWVHHFRFHPVRKWEFDFALPPLKIALELDGGVYAQGRHNRPKGFLDDCDKMNGAASLGWRVFRLGTGQITSDRLELIHGTIKASLPD